VAAKRKVDYERIEPGWRAGVLSPPQLAADYTKDTGVSVSHTAIIKHFKNLGVPRDLAAKVKAKADAMVLEAMVSTKVSSETIKRETTTVNDAAAIVTNIRLGHRSDIGRLRSLALTLLSELEGQSADPGMLEQLGELLAAPDDKGVDKLNDLYRKIISTPSRIDSAKKVAETLRHAIGLEREAFGLDEKKPTGGDGQMTIIQI